MQVCFSTINLLRCIFASYTGYGELSRLLSRNNLHEKETYYAVMEQCYDALLGACPQSMVTDLWKAGVLE